MKVIIQSQSEYNKFGHSTDNKVIVAVINIFKTPFECTVILYLNLTVYSKY